MKTLKSLKKRIREIAKDQVTNNETIFKIYSNLRFVKGCLKHLVLTSKRIRLFWKVKPYTMASFERLHNIYELSDSIEKNSAGGAFVECGVWRGGCSAVMAYVANKADSNRKIWLFDSFEGLPEPTEKDGVKAKIFASNRTSGSLRSINKTVATIKQVKRIFSKLNVNMNNVTIRKGWFQNTLPKAKREIGDIAILRLDGDLYESTKVCLENLYDLVVKGGFVLIDDYGTWKGCKKAVDEFIKKRNLKVKLIKTDNTESYFKK